MSTTITEQSVLTVFKNQPEKELSMADIATIMEISFPNLWLNEVMWELIDDDLIVRTGSQKYKYVEIVR